MNTRDPIDAGGDRGSDSSAAPSSADGGAAVGIAVDPDRLDEALDAFRAGDARLLESLVPLGLGRQEGPGVFDCLTQATVDPWSTTMPHIDGYRIIRQIGRGGMGVVFEAEQPELRRRVAIKIAVGATGFDVQHLALFRREVQILAQLRHPGIAAIYGAGRTADGRPCCVMELVDGHHLLDFVTATASCAGRPAAELAERLSLFRQICDAVAFAHQKGVIHRDLKPGNILVVAPTNAGATDTTSRTAQVKVLDFGLAKIVEGDAPQLTSVQSVEGLVGTLLYMSPEQVAGAGGVVDTRSDVYSLGVILYEMLTGATPHGRRGGPALETMRAIAETPPRLPSQVDAALRGDLETIVLKALDKDPSRRYQSVAELGDDVARFQDRRPILARSDSRWYVRRKLLRRHWRGATAVAAGFLVCAVTALVTTQLWLSKERSLRAVEGTNAALRRVLRAADPDVLGRDVTVRAMLENVIAQADRGEFANDRKTEAFIRATTGSCLASVGAPEQADVQLRTAQRLYEEAQETESANYAECLHNLAIVARFLRQDEALDLMREALALRMRIFGPDDPTTVESMHDIGYFLRDHRLFDEAEATFRQAIAARERIFGPDSAEVALSCNSLGQLLKQVERWDDAEPLFRRARSIYQHHPPTTMSAHNLNNLGDIARRDERFDEAIDLDLEALDIFRESFVKGDEVFKRASSMLARHLETAGRHADAAELRLELLTNWEEVPPRFPADRAFVSLALANDLIELGRFEEAAARCEFAHDEYERLAIPDKLRAAAESMVRLHEAWELAAPDEGHQAMADSWRERVAPTE